MDRPLLPASFEARLLRGAGRMGGWALLSVVGAAWVSLLTSSLGTPGLSSSSGGGSNLLGPPGAAVSDLLLQTLGFASVLVLLAPMFWGLELVLSGRVEKFRVKAAFFPLSVLLLAGAISALPTYTGWPLRNGFGGIMGDVVYSFTSGLAGLTSAAGAPALAGLMLFTAGFAALTYSIGAALSDLAVAVKKQELPDLAEKAEAWQQGLKTAALGVRDRVQTLSNSRAQHVDADEPWLDARPEPTFRAAPRAAAIHDHDSYQDHSETTLAVTPRDFDGDEDFEPEIDFDSESITAEASRIARKFAPKGVAEAEPDIEPETRASARAKREAAAAGFRPAPAPAAMRPYQGGPATYQRFSLNLLKRAQGAKPGAELTQTALRASAQMLEETLGDFGVKGEIRDIKPGPVVTLFELEPSRGTKSSRVIGLADDIARSMSAMSVRVAVVPGRNAIGIELPNARRDKVMLRELLESDAFRMTDGALPMVLGKSIEGEPIVADLAHMPHLLVAGTTGSGKSVGLNAMILSLLYKNAPDDCRFIMIDPKMLELSVYNGIPHLLCPVVTEPQKAVAALNWVVAEMEERYKRMAKLSVRRIDVFNNRVRNAKRRGEMIARTVQTGFDRDTGRAIYESQELDLEPMPNIVVVIDEFADLMAVAGKDVEVAVQRIAQKARAAGIHLIMATQRPSVDVITGTIKANFPTRVSFKVASKVDSRTILNEQGAEQLLGNGDMLYAAGSGQTMRVHGPFVSDEEIENIAQHLRDQGVPRYVEGITEHGVTGDDGETGANGSGGSDDLYEKAKAIVLRDRKASVSYVQRRLSIGYNRAADLIERMEADGLISAANGVGKREILSGAA